MGRIKKVLALVIAMVVMTAMALPALAEEVPAGRTNGAPLENKSITLQTPSAGHTYTLYQVFKGTHANINDGDDVLDVLGNLAWGDNVDSAAATADGATYAGKTVEQVAGTITNTAEGAQDFAIAIDPYLTGGSSKTAGTGDSVADLVWSPLSEGYYIIKDTTDNLPAGEAADAVVVQVLDNVTIKAKAGTTEFDKKVADRNDSTMKPTVYDAWGNTSDYDVGDDVPYQLTITLPANFTSYETYTMTVKDKMDSGLKFNKDVEVKIGETVVPANKYVVKTEDIPTEEAFEIVFADVKGITGAGNSVEFTITYSAELTGENVVYGNPGNKNEAWLTYSNNPTSDSTGDSVHKTTVTFTYKFEVDKVDQYGEPLDGAAFELEKQVMAEDGETSWEKLTLIEGTSGTVFTFDGLDDGLYRITETATPAGYNSIDPIYFIVEAVHSETLTKLEVKQAGEDGKALDTTAVTATFETTLTRTEEKAAGLIDTKVENAQGSTLPSTGGMGTTIFYVIGGLLVLAAAIVLISRKRVQQ